MIELTEITRSGRGGEGVVTAGLNAAELAVETCFWPLFEVENGRWILNYKPKNMVPVTEWPKTEGRFQHLFRDERQDVLEAFQQKVDERWKSLLLLCEA